MKRTYSGAEQRLLHPESDSQRLFDEAWGMVVHTTADGPGDTDIGGYFDREDIPFESTFFLPMRHPMQQLMYCGQRVDTQADGNEFDVPGVGRRGYDSVECEDDGKWESGFNEHQLEELTKLFVWYWEEQNLPDRWIQFHKDEGFGHHTILVREDGGFGPMIRGKWNPWTVSQGKVCPGNARAIQLRDEVWPEFQKRIHHQPRPKPPAGMRTDMPVLFIADKVLTGTLYATFEDGSVRGIGPAEASWYARNHPKIPQVKCTNKTEAKRLRRASP